MFVKDLICKLFKPNIFKITYPKLNSSHFLYSFEPLHSKISGAANN